MVNQLIGNGENGHAHVKCGPVPFEWCTAPAGTKSAATDQAQATAASTADAEAAATAASKAEAEAEAVKAASKAETAPESKPTVKPESKPTVKPESKPTVKRVSKPTVKRVSKPTVKRLSPAAAAAKSKAEAEKRRKRNESMQTEALMSFPGELLRSVNGVLAGVSGVYALLNTVNGKVYIGSAVSLRTRLLDYGQPAYLKAKSNLLIVKALTKYGMGAFTMLLLELTLDSSTALEAEQRAMDEFGPEYNVNPTAANSTGSKHTQEAKDKISRAKKGQT